MRTCEDRSRRAAPSPATRPSRCVQDVIWCVHYAWLCRSRCLVPQRCSLARHTSVQVCHTPPHVRPGVSNTLFGVSKTLFGVCPLRSSVSTTVSGVSGAQAAALLPRPPHVRPGVSCTSPGVYKTLFGVSKTLFGVCPSRLTASGVSITSFGMRPLPPHVRPGVSYTLFGVS